MTRESTRQRFGIRILLGALALLLCATQGFAIFGVWRRHARRWAVVGTTVAVSSAAAHSAAASQSAAESTAASTAAAQSAAAASQASADAAKAAAAAAAKPAAPPAAAQKTPQQRLEELNSLYKQGLISKSDYDAAKAKILAQITQ
ncbi:MAG TPA: SHOCT domain-containing protein [Thermoanaerobaculia bacterium]|nr:SHOCT domain-containing protein [Thermoanaerobaculia bacterium]